MPGSAMQPRRRNSIESAVVLKSTRIGEIHRSVTLFTADRGLLYATAHGAAKATSRLKAATVLFAHVRVYLYHDPVRDSYKVTDVEPLDLHPSIRVDLSKFFTASLWVEIVLRSQGGGGHPQPVHALLLEALGALAGLGGGDAAALSVLSVQVLWRSLGQLGIAPDLGACSRCGRALAAGEELRVSLTGAEGWCRGCAGAAAGGERGAATPTIGLTGEARAYLAATEHLPLMAATASPFTAGDGLRKTLQLLVQHGIETPLNSLRCAAGIL